ncbi:CRISPR-associated protein [Corynebacterium kutscheri]|uniref:CRISPR-associated protein n=1 Tax=Corynebacterium kutscheri TaxID=35755 RepID=A0A0F6R027_9CORY|nr:type I-E CRISPR-associated endoribonuclease Cas2e [Corynebacterium kutscheri]AKE41055.1 CRISPR-associated protein Cas2 [Corynebacterium kutscheri]VEH06943.1 CRISPR-associated protein [Corynebacterium kutscheri]VEH09355.1 CRISPR-associated protein [Corynebacterium kutscheri]VEH79438.1 CRISPR-associated protein [Corynebacterium kutscheri]
MITIVLTACPAGLRGQLNRWLFEISAGVFVGHVSTRIRDRLWSIIVSELKNGRAIMAFSTSKNETGFEIKVHRHDWEIIDSDGIPLVLRPTRSNPESPLRKGWSKASQRRRKRK